MTDTDGCVTYEGGQSHHTHITSTSPSAITTTVLSRGHPLICSTNISPATVTARCSRVQRQEQVQQKFNTNFNRIRIFKLNCWLPYQNKYFRIPNLRHIQVLIADSLLLLGEGHLARSPVGSPVRHRM